MGRTWEAFDEKAACDECGKIGAYDVYGDLICRECWSAAARRQEARDSVEMMAIMMYYHDTKANLDDGGRVVVWADADEAAKGRYCSLAVVALEAIREPSKGMIAAGACNPDIRLREWAFSERTQLRGAEGVAIGTWRAMVDHLLKHQPARGCGR